MPCGSCLCEHVRGEEVVCMPICAAAACVRVCVSLHVLIKDGQASAISPLAIAAT